MTGPNEQTEAAARQGFVELVQDRLPQTPPPAAAAIAHAVFDAAGVQVWEVWPERVDLDGETMELPVALHAVIDDIRRDVAARVAAGDVGGADVHVLHAIVDRLSKFPIL